MKTIPLHRALTCLAAATLLAVGTAAASAAATPLQGQIQIRPVAPSDNADYGLPSTTQKSAGLSTIALGEPAYLEALVNIAIPSSNIVGVTWTLTSQPVGSTAVLTNSPLGTNVPIYHPTDRLVAQIAGRTFFRPDVRGEYRVTAAISTDVYGSTNVTVVLNGGTYMGLNTCKLCHSGGQGAAPDMFTTYTNTLHASKFTRGINGQIPGYSKNCISCHTVGYDVNTNAVNGAFDDVAAQLGWSFPTNLTNSNFASMPGALQNLANIQCESCHGPGSEHAFSLGATNRISVTWNSGNCGSCHDAKTHHNKNAEWANSKHAIATRSPSGPGREGCVGCHTASGYVGRISNASTTNTTYDAIGCATCHDPHDAANPHQLRTVAPVTLLDNKTTITNGGNALLCISCHRSRRDATNYVMVTTGGSTFGPHENPQADMLMGANAITYGKTIPSSAHREQVEELCVTCHMQNIAITDKLWLHAGGHTWSMKYETATNTMEATAACTDCHGSISTFNFARQDFDGDGVIEGVQTEVQHLLDKLAALLPPVGPKSDITINSSWTKQQLKAGYNYRFVQKDGSLGVHNLAYAVGLLKASIADLTGDANTDGLPDAWQIQYFGSTSSASAAPNASPAGDGIPNWLKCSLGLDPTKPGITVPGGVVWASGGTMGGGTNTLHIYTAAEVSFETEVGKSYQIQGISSMGGEWQNIGSPIAGTGNAVSYVTPMRSNAQQYFRIVTQ